MWLLLQLGNGKIAPKSMFKNKKMLFIQYLLLFLKYLSHLNSSLQSNG